jgi:hypothetical protein
MAYTQKLTVIDANPSSIKEGIHYHFWPDLAILTNSWGGFFSFSKQITGWGLQNIDDNLLLPYFQTQNSFYLLVCGYVTSADNRVSLVKYKTNNSVNQRSIQHIQK